MNTFGQRQHVEVFADESGHLILRVNNEGFYINKQRHVEKLLILQVK